MIIEFMIIEVAINYCATMLAVTVITGGICEIKNSLIFLDTQKHCENAFIHCTKI